MIPINLFIGKMKCFRWFIIEIFIAFYLFFLIAAYSKKIGMDKYNHPRCFNSSSVVVSKERSCLGDKIALTPSSKSKSCCPYFILAWVFFRAMEWKLCMMLLNHRLEVRLYLQPLLHLLGVFRVFMLANRIEKFGNGFMWCWCHIAFYFYR